MGALGLSAPVGGWNARDSLELMPPTDAVRMENLIPDAGSVRSRGGSETFVSGLGGAVESLVAFSALGARKLLACANGAIVDITSGAASSLATGKANNRWQYAHFNNKAVLVNGADTPLVYDGTSLSAITATGPTLTSLVGVVGFKGRAIYWENQAAKFWYAAAGAYQGTLTAFDLSLVAKKGGHVVQILTWTRDAGDGMDDMLAILFSTGEAVIYQGTDPGSALNFSMVGRYDIGAPLSIRSHTRVATTEVLFTDDGILTLDEAINNARVNSDINFGGKIARACKAAAGTYRANFGWDGVYYPAGNLYIANVPVSSSASEQFVRNTNNGAWCKFTGWDVRCLTVHADKLYFGTSDGKVKQADVGQDDDGEYIDYTCLTAYMKLGQPGLKAQLTSVRMVTNNKFQRAMDVLAYYDYGARDVHPMSDPAEQVQAQWDISYWDTDYWATPLNDPASQEALPALRNCNAFGFAVALLVRFRSKVQRLYWYSSTLIFKHAGVN